MSTVLTPYLHFDGEAVAAMTLYAEVLGGELTVTTFGQAGQGAESDADRVMHSQIDVAGVPVLMGGDVPSGMDAPAGSRASMSISGDEPAAQRASWDLLLATGTVIEPLATAPWGDEFGMLLDRFGIVWMVNIGGAAAA